VPFSLVCDLAAAPDAAYVLVLANIVVRACQCHRREQNFIVVERKLSARCEKPESGGGATWWITTRLRRDSRLVDSENAVLLSALVNFLRSYQQRQK
jgi:hypothetical protein